MSLNGFRGAAGVGRGAQLLVAALLALVLTAGGAQAQAQDSRPLSVFDWGALFGDWLPQMPAETPVTEEELRSLFCIGAAGVIGTASILFSGTAAVAGGAVQATLVALPALAGSMWFGCALGSAAAPGFVWLVRHGNPLF